MLGNHYNHRIIHTYVKITAAKAPHFWKWSARAVREAGREIEGAASGQLGCGTVAS